MSLFSRIAMFACVWVLAGCSEDRQPVQNQQSQVDPGAPQAGQTPDGGITPPVPETTAPLRITRAIPVSDTTVAIHLASMGIAPASEAPQLVLADPKELDRADQSPMSLMGFHLKGTRISARPQDGTAVVELMPESASDELVVIPASEWGKLTPGVHTITATGSDGTTADLPINVSIE